MRYLMSRAKYERCRAELDEADLPWFEATFAAYPDDLSEPEWTVDQDRIAARLAELQYQLPPPPGGPWSPQQEIWTWPKGNGKASAAPPPPWEPIGNGCWTAPAGTPKPGDSWVDVVELMLELQAENDRVEPMRRYLLDNTVTTRIESTVPRLEWDTPKGDPLEAIKSWMRIWRMRDLPPGRRLHAGDAAIAAFTAGVPRAPARPAWQSGSLGSLTGIPIVRDEDLPSNVWQLRDARTGDVLDEGTCGASVEECERVVAEYLDQLAEEAEVPRHLFWD
jgi:hypothetical protein